ncbi:MAG: RNA-binding protein [Nannocystis sp.]|nr:RNA-binding protein [Nannocystis sp.]
MPSRLFVGGLSQSTSTLDLRTMFETFGPVDDAIVVTDRDMGESRGFGFVTMADRRDAAIATRELSGREVDGRTLVVRPATDRTR